MNRPLPLACTAAERIVRVGDVADLIMGQAPPGRDCNKDGIGTVFVKAGEFADRFPVVCEWTTSPLKLATNRDVLVCVVGATAGKVNQAIECAIGRSVAAVRPSSRLHTEFLYHFLLTKVAELRSKSQGLAQGVITREMLAELLIPLPPLPEQRRIAEVLDRADALRAKRRAALAQLDSLTQSIFLDLFGDPADNVKGFARATLGEIINFVGGSQPPRQTFRYEPSADCIRLVQIRDFKTDEFKTYIPRSLARRFFDSDDVMIGRYGPPVFQILRGLSGSYNVALIKAEPRDGILKDFIFHLLQESRLHSFVVARSERTAGQTGVNLDLLENYPVFRPPLALQREFARRVAVVERLKVSQRAALAKLDELFASLQHRAFRGEL